MIAPWVESLGAKRDDPIRIGSQGAWLRRVYPSRSETVGKFSMQHGPRVVQKMSLASFTESPGCQHRDRNAAKTSEPLRKREELARSEAAILKDSSPFPTH